MKGWEASIWEQGRRAAGKNLEEMLAGKEGDRQQQ